MKRNVPYPLIEEALEDMTLVSLTRTLCKKALQDPTEDFEDNARLHSAAKTECATFLTNDKALLFMAFFGKTRILPKLA